MDPDTRGIGHLDVTSTSAWIFIVKPPRERSMQPGRSSFFGRCTAGLPIALKLTEGQAHDGRSAPDMLDAIVVGGRPASARSRSQKFEKRPFPWRSRPRINSASLQAALNQVVGPSTDTDRMGGCPPQEVLVIDFWGLGPPGVQIDNKSVMLYLRYPMEATLVGESVVEVTVAGRLSQGSKGDSGNGRNDPTSLSPIVCSWLRALC
jgi:hypothetical protein